MEQLLVMEQNWGNALAAMVITSAFQPGNVMFVNSSPEQMRGVIVAQLRLFVIMIQR